MGAAASVENVSSKVKDLGNAYEQYEKVVRDNAIDGSVLESLKNESAQDVKKCLGELGVTNLLHQNKILQSMGHKEKESLQSSESKEIQQLGAILSVLNDKDHKSTVSVFNISLSNDVDMNATTTAQNNMPDSLKNNNDAGCQNQGSKLGPVVRENDAFKGNNNAKSRNGDVDRKNGVDMDKNTQQGKN